MVGIFLGVSVGRIRHMRLKLFYHSWQIQPHSPSEIFTEFTVFMKLPENYRYPTLNRMSSWLTEMSSEESGEWELAMIRYSFDQEDWSAARNLLLRLLCEDGKTASDELLRSYLCCCAESSSGVQPLPSLASLAHDLYQEHGMENAQARKL